MTLHSLISLLMLWSICAAKIQEKMHERDKETSENYDDVFVFARHAGNLNCADNTVHSFLKHSLIPQNHATVMRLQSIHFSTNQLFHYIFPMKNPFHIKLYQGSIAAANRWFTHWTQIEVMQNCYYCFNLLHSPTRWHKHQFSKQ